MVGNTLATGRLPNPGNAEFVLYVLALLVAALVVWIADTLNVNSWFEFFRWITVAYILSRGVAKASRVFEQ
jgi:uncharacterized protein (DUF983 family)